MGGAAADASLEAARAVAGPRSLQGRVMEFARSCILAHPYTHAVFLSVSPMTTRCCSGAYGAQGLNVQMVDLACQLRKSILETSHQGCEIRLPQLSLRHPNCSRATSCIRQLPARLPIAVSKKSNPSGIRGPDMRRDPLVVIRWVRDSRLEAHLSARRRGRRVRQHAAGGCLDASA